MNSLTGVMDGGAGTPPVTVTKIFINKVHLGINPTTNIFINHIIQIPKTHI